MAAGDTRIGGAYFEVSVDSSKVAPGMREAEAQAKSSAANVGKAVEGAGESAAMGFRKAIAQVTGFVGSLTAAVGTATLFYNIGKKIGDELFADDARTRAEAFFKTLEAKSAKDSLKELDEQIQDLQNRISDLQSGRVGPSVLNDTVRAANAQKELAILEAERQQKEIQARVERAALEAKAEAEAEAAIAKQLDGIQQVTDAATKALDARLAAQQEEESATLTMLENLRVEYNQWLDELAAKKKADRERETADAIADARRVGEENVRQAQRYASELRAANDALTSGFNANSGAFGSLTAGINELVKIAKANSQQPVPFIY